MISLFMFLLLRESWSFGNTEADQMLLQQLPVGTEIHTVLPRQLFAVFLFYFILLELVSFQNKLLPFR